MPVETPEAQQGQNHVNFLENFLDELRPEDAEKEARIALVIEPEPHIDVCRLEAGRRFSRPEFLAPDIISRGAQNATY